MRWPFPAAICMWGGAFSRAGGSAAANIAKWNGSAWSALGSGLNGQVNALAVSGTDLYVGGSFTSASGSAATNIAKWDGSAWSALGTGVNGQINALAVSGSDLYVGGYFTLAGGKVSAYLARANLATLIITFTSTNIALVSWPSPSTGFTLQQNTDLNTTNWVTPSESVADNGTIKSIIVNPPGENRFYRLFRP